MLQNLSPDHRVNFHLLEFFRGQAAGLRNNVLGNGQLANVMQQRRCLQGLHFRRFQAHVLGHLERIHPHPLQVIVRGMVFGFDRQCQGLDGAHMQVGHFLDVALLVIEFSQVHTIGAVDQVNDG